MYFEFREKYKSGLCVENDFLREVSKSKLFYLSIFHISVIIIKFMMELIHSELISTGLPSQRHY